MTLKTEWKSHISACQNSINEIRSSHDGNKAHNTGHITSYTLPYTKTRKKRSCSKVNLSRFHPTCHFPTQLKPSFPCSSHLSCHNVKSSQPVPNVLCSPLLIIMNIISFFSMNASIFCICCAVLFFLVVLVVVGALYILSRWNTKKTDRRDDMDGMELIQDNLTRTFPSSSSPSSSSTSHNQHVQNFLWYSLIQKMTTMMMMMWMQKRNKISFWLYNNR